MIPLREMLQRDGTGAARRRRPSLPGVYHFDPNALDNMIDAVLTAPAFDSVAANALAARGVYANVVERLNSNLGCPSLATLLATGRRDLWPLRLARAFHVLPPENIRGGGSLRDRYTAEDLRASTHLGARTALAALGEIDWSDMNCRERAAFLLAHVVTRMRWGAVS